MNHILHCCCHFNLQKITIEVYGECLSRQRHGKLTGILVCPSAVSSARYLVLISINGSDIQHSKSYKPQLINKVELVTLPQKDYWTRLGTSAATPLLFGLYTMQQPLPFHLSELFSDRKHWPLHREERKYHGRNHILRAHQDSFWEIDRNVHVNALYRCSIDQLGQSTLYISAGRMRK